MRLLLAEDERELSRALVAILKRNQYSVDAVYDGQEAYTYLQSAVYDGVILDIMMPKMDGLTVLKKIREEKNSVPVLLLTAKSEVDDRVSGLDSGADDYLCKPFSTKELLARIRSMTRRTNQVTDLVLQFENVSLNRTTYELSTDGHSVRLTNKEFQIMEQLLLHPNQILSSDQLMDKIWGWDSETDIRVVWVYISNLRKKLIALRANVQIKATRNIGYSLEALHD